MKNDVNLRQKNRDNLLVYYYSFYNSLENVVSLNLIADIKDLSGNFI